MENEALEWQKLFDFMVKENIPASEAICYIKNGLAGKTAADRHEPKKVLDPSELLLEVDYSKSLMQAIMAGKYNKRDKDIIANHFPVPVKMAGKKTVVSVKVFSFDFGLNRSGLLREMIKNNYHPDAEKIVKRLRRHNCHPADIRELLALGAAFPHLQRRYLIIALGSSWRNNGEDFFPYLGIDNYERHLCLSDFPVGWLPNFHFLGVID